MKSGSNTVVLIESDWNLKEYENYMKDIQPGY